MNTWLNIEDNNSEHTYEYEELLLMMAIYHDVGGSHSTAVAAHIHTNQLPMEVTPTKEELLQIKTFDRMEKKDQGHLIYIGRDEMGVDCLLYTSRCV